MTIEEAIKTLKRAKAFDWYHPTDYEVAFDMAIEALERLHLIDKQNNIANADNMIIGEIERIEQRS